ncbi:hypothetical protein BAZOLSSOX_713 [uncultured Gammaproteobacteria bacterium]|jgi:mxaD protein|nr:hypothetical protein BAZOLSSOX_713 [uncultured Gammaproteobacteria bacterium]
MLIKYCFITLLLLSVVAESHGPTRKKSQEQIVINVSTEKVWQRIKNFSDLSWHPLVEKVAMLKKGNKKGSIRSIMLKNGGVINEKLKKYQPNKMRYDYKIIDMSTVKTIQHLGDDIAVKVLPVSNYSASIQVTKKGKNQSIVTWKGAYYRGFMNNNPPKELNEIAAKKAVNGVYRAGLDNLKVILEK